MSIIYSAIGVIHSPFHDIENVPIQPAGAVGVRGILEIDSRYEPGLKDLEGFSHILVLYHFHLARQYRLVVTPFLDCRPHGVFATRAPARPNAIGLSVLRLLSVRGTVLEVENVDIVDGTPLLDIKPYAPQFDHFEVERIGWLAGSAADVSSQRSDGRFR